MQPDRQRISKGRQFAWLAGLAVLAVAAYAGVAVLPPWLRYLLGTDARWLRRQAAVAFLDGFLIAYVSTLIAAIASTIVLAWRRWRGPLTLRLARLLLLTVSVLLGLAGLEAGAAVRRLWLDRSLQMPPAVSRSRITLTEGGPGPERERVAAPSLPHGLPAHPADADTWSRPLKFLVIGESSGRGEPYHPWLSVGQIVAWRLEQVFPGRPIDVDIWATGGATLEVMHNKLAGLTYRPDALIIYVGHNEFQARYAWMRDVDYYVDGDLPSRVALYPLMARFSRFSPLCRLIEQTRERQLVDLIPPRTVTRELVDRPVCTMAESAAIVADFGRRLESIAGYCATIGTLPIFVIPPSNDAGFDPSRSILSPETTRDQRIAFARAVSRARAFESKDRAAAMRAHEELVRVHPEFAEAHYRLARMLEQTGRWDLAQVHYIAAREADAMPLRCPEPFREAFRAVAQRHPDVILIDGPRALAAESPHGIVGDDFFHDAQHPNLRGYAALSQDVLNQLGARRAFGWPAATPVPVVDIEACLRHFEIDAVRWTKICSRGAAFFRATAYIRYDPKFRNERSATYLRSASAIDSGVSPAEADIPGWPLPPRPATSHVIPLESRQ